MDSDRKDAALLLDLIYALPSDLATSECCDALRAGAAALRREQVLQRLVDNLYELFTLSSREEIAARFGESRCIDDSSRINYALEWLDDYVSAEEVTP